MSTALINISRPSGRFYSIQLTGSRYRHWKNLESSKSQLTFKWDDLVVSPTESISGLAISVAQAYPSENRDTIKALARSIQHTFKIDKHDKILGANGNSLDKVGFIEEKALVKNNEVTLTISWVSEKRIGDTNEVVFNPSAEIQQLNSSQLKKLECQFGESLALVYSELPDKKEPEQKGMSKSTGYYRGLSEIDNMPLLLEENRHDQGGKLRLFYGTNRTRSESQKEIEYEKELGT